MDTGFFTEAVAEAVAKDVYVSGKLRVFRQIDTTMRIVDELIAQGHEAGTIALALDQTNGQGGVDPKTGLRRKWQSRKGNFMASVIIGIPPGRPTKEGEIVAEYCVYSIAKELFHRGAVQAKLPNDVLVDGRKICGTIIFPKYALLPRTHERRVNLGIGVNLAMAPDADQATTCFKDHGVDIGVGEFAALLASRLNEVMAEYREHGVVHLLKKMNLADPETGDVTLWPNNAGPPVRGQYHNFSVGTLGEDPQAEFMQIRLANGEIAQFPTKSYSARTVIKNDAASLSFFAGALSHA